MTGCTAYHEKLILFMSLTALLQCNIALQTRDLNNPCFGMDELLAAILRPSFHSISMNDRCWVCLARRVGHTTWCAGNLLNCF
jgi:hypothetical protein